MKRIRQRLQDLPPGQMLMLYYAAAILLGAVLLSLPVAAVGAPLPFLDALFTATSAQCVTGLAVVDTGTRFSLFGQTVILVLIQIGGLGIITFSVYLFFYLRLGVGMRGRWIIHETLLHTPVDSMQALIRDIVKHTLIIEGVGALLLALVFVPDLGLFPGLFSAIFHSVSAFCNAGFSLFPDSLIRYQGHPLVNFTIMGLIVLGGIGFLVIREVLALLAGRGRRRFSLHSRLVLWTTGVLIAGGFLLILLSDGHTLLRHGMPRGLLIALFQSVTARTAGFNTIDLNLLTVPTLLLMMLLMFIGASPGSAGGGIKTTSLAIFFAIFHSRLQGNEHTNILRRTIPSEVVTKVLTLVMLATLTIVVGLFALLLVQANEAALAGRGLYLDYAFEVVSALATVGLSLGATASLLPAGKVIVIGLMYIGRVGLLTLAFTLIRRTRGGAVHYSEENIMIG
jgi:trk system potassium uptake protein TrkH